MDKAKVGKLRMAMAEALAKVALDHDVRVRVGNITYSDSGLKATVNVEEETSDGLPKKYESDWKQAVQLGIVQAGWLGVITQGRKGAMKVVGYDFNRPKNCVVLKKVNDGKIYLTTMHHFASHKFSTPAPLLDDADQGEKVLNIKDLAQEVNK